MIHLILIVAVLILAGAALAEDAAKLGGHAVVFGVTSSSTTDLAKINAYAVVTGGSTPTPARGSGFGSLSLGIN
jgi:hypothetical protein